ncbi:MAG TPA: feruloyl-CoA synthase [Solirubrobacteraceae bacterium]|jgi:feruloyl-CoA synthase|nr:feruloyl-CoA synthase [Solirubrobacteraceae bacterium]
MSPLLELQTFATPDIEIERRDDGSAVLSSRHAPPEAERSIPAVLRRRAAEHPDRLLAAQRDSEDRWIMLTYGEAEARAGALAEAFTRLGLGPGKPLMILSGNSLEHLLVSLGAYAAQVPVMPISVAYSLMSADHARIKAIAGLTEPGLVFADDAGPFGAALAALAPTVSQALVARGEREGALRLDGLLATAPGDRTGATLDPEPDTVAKLLFTSGSTGVPKGVVNTHRMLCSNQAMLQAIWPFLADEPPIMVDWLPWSHTFGANHNLNLALFNGGTIYIDDGKPAPALFGRSIAALSDVPPTLYFNVPAGYALLAPALESDPRLAERFFSRLRFMFYAAAALPDALAARLRKLAAEHADHDVPLTSSWGTTETAPCATSMHYLGAPTGCIGVPIPGCAIKLAPVGDRLEIRVKGPNVTPGYFRRPELTQTAFDEDGFYRSGDAVRLIDEQAPNAGMLFDGRIAENFKLLTGTWVAAGALRTGLISAAGVLSEAVICGQDAAYVAAMAWINQAEARRLTGATEDVALDDPTLREHLAGALRSLNDQAGSASRIERLLLLAQPPSLDAGEITDKGYLNQRRTLECRSTDVERLYADPADPTVISGSGG